MITFKLFDLNKENMKFLFVGKYQIHQSSSTDRYFIS